MKNIFFLVLMLCGGLLGLNAQCGFTPSFSTTAMDCPSGGSICFTISGGLEPYYVSLYPGSGIGTTATFPYDFVAVLDGTVSTCFNNLPAGNYTIGINDCPTQYVVNVAAIDAPDVTFTQGDFACNGNPTVDVLATFGGAPQAGYEVMLQCLSTGVMFLGTTDINGEVNIEVEYTDTYFAIAANSSGCGDFEFIALEEITPLAFVDISVSDGCYHEGLGTISVIASYGESCEFTYTISSAEYTTSLIATDDGVMFNNVPAGTYDISATCASCGGSILEVGFELEITNEILMPYEVIAPCNGLCNGTINVDVSGGTGVGFDYEWLSNGLPIATSEDITNLCAGEYQLAVTDLGDFCTNTIVVSLESFMIEATFDVGNSGYGTSCYYNFDGTITVEGNGDNGPYSYSYTSIIGLTTSTATGTIADLPWTIYGIGLGSYEISVTDENGCEVTDQVLVAEPEVPPGLALTVNVLNMACNGSLGSAEIIVGNTDPNITILGYCWLSEGACGASGVVDLPNEYFSCSGAECLGSASSISGLGPGMYTIWVDYENALGYSCSDMAFFEITGFSPTISLLNCMEIGCYDHDDNPATVGQGLINVEIIPTGTYTYNWENTSTEIWACDDYSSEGTNGEDLITECAGTWLLTVENGSGCTAQFESNCLQIRLRDADFDSDGDLSNGVQIDNTTALVSMDPTINHFGRQVEVLPGNTWGIDNTSLQFAEYVGITLLTDASNGSELNGTFVTFTHYCNRYWDGIEVTGSGYRLANAVGSDNLNPDISST